MTRRVAKKWIKRAADEHAVGVGCWFDEAAAVRVREFMERFLWLPPTQGQAERSSVVTNSAQPFRLMAWQWTEVIAPMFGWKRADGRRRFTRGYLSTPKKNGKTGLASAITMYMLMADGEPQAECYSVAGTREQAGLVYDDCSGMARASPEIIPHLTPLDSKKKIVFRDGCEYQTLASDARNNEGYRPNLVIYDELHAAKGRALFDAMAYGGAARRQPLNLTTTTAGDGVDPTHICREQYDYAKRIIAGDHFDPGFFACIYEAAEECELDDVAAIKAANPSIGETLRLDELLTAAAEATASPAKEAAFRRYRLNQWVSNSDAWIKDSDWSACPSTIDLASLKGQPAVYGLDLSSVDDLTALAIAFPPAAGQPMPVLMRFYLPADNVQKLEQKHKVPYGAWAKLGWITLTSGNTVDYDEVLADIKVQAKSYPPIKVALDRGWQGQAIESRMIADGFDVVPVGQGWRSQSQPLRELERLVRGRLLNHGGNPVLKWNALSTVAKVDDAGNYSLTRRMSRAKIDGIAALVNAVHCIVFGAKTLTAADVLA